MRRLVDILPPWVVFLVGLLLVAGVGYVDFVTGDYSLLVFYLIPVSFVSWYGGRWSGAAVAVASGAARFISDYSLYSDLFLHYWNTVQDLLFFLLAAVLVSVLRVELTGSGR